ncbi:MAG TPA: hypothetical protein VIV11_25865 [Kofleriaceae bacterium]
MRASSLISIALLVRGTWSHADSISQEVSVGTTVVTAADAASQWISDRIAGSWEPSERWRVELEMSATRSRSTAISARASDGVGGSLAADLSPSSHWSLGLILGWAPYVTKSSFARIEAEGLPDDMVEADVNVVSSSWMTSVGLSATYDSGGTGDFSTTASFRIGGSYYDSEQAIVTVRDPDTLRTFTPAELREHCEYYECDAELREGLWPQWTQVQQFTLGASVTETLYQDTDLGMDIEFYLYNQDPTRAGYFTMTTVDGGNLGEGISVTPMDYAVSPSIAHRFGDVAATGTLSYGKYIHDLGHDVTASLRVQVKVPLAGDKRLRLYTKFSSSWDVTPDYLPSQSVSLAVGGQYGW